MPHKYIHNMLHKYRHKKNKWITNGILKSLKTKNKLYKVLQQTCTDNYERFEQIKVRLTDFVVY